MTKKMNNIQDYKDYQISAMIEGVLGYLNCQIQIVPKDVDKVVIFTQRNLKSFTIQICSYVGEQRQSSNFTVLFGELDQRISEIAEYLEEYFEYNY